MSERITTTCQHSHTVTLRLNEGEWRPMPRDWFPWYSGARLTTGRAFEARIDTYGWVEPHMDPPPAIRAELEAALAAAEASCGGCGCAERLRAEARVAGKNHPIAQGALEFAADFLDAAPDARGSNLSDEQPAPVSEQGHAKKRAEWNDPKEGQ